METHKASSHWLLKRFLIAPLSFFVTSAGAYAQIFVANGVYHGSGTIGEYTTSGATVNDALISGLMDFPQGDLRTRIFANGYE
jgi:hypothetical protein